MTQILSDFILALRAADVRVSTAESIDAAATLDVIGFEQRDVVKEALSQVLAKTDEDKTRFRQCFDRFFAFEHVEGTLSESNNPIESVSKNADNSGEDKSELGYIGTPTDKGLLSALGDADAGALQQAIATAARNVRLPNIRIFTQRGMYIRRMLEDMGIDEVDDKIFELARSEKTYGKELQQLREAKARLFELVSEVVDRQMLLYTANAWPQLREEILHKTPLARIEARDFKIMQELVYKLAKRLVAMHARRRRVSRRGHLDVRRTIRRNIKYDGLLFETVWKKIRIERPKVVAVCDVSGSVENVAGFLLLFLYSITEIIPKVRAFAFSSRLGEVTEMFNRLPVAEAVAQTLHDYGHGSTDYGSAMADLEQLTLEDIDHRTTVLVLGDARSNYGDPGDHALRRIHERARRVLWLNPEPKSFWNTGDSAMRKLAVACDRVEPCRSLRHLERIVGEIARTAL